FPARATRGPSTRLEARIVFTSSYGASGETISGVEIREVLLSTSSRAPISRKSRCMVRMSRTRGTRCKMTGSEVRSAAASSGSAAFWEPLAATEPLSRAPPLMTNLSILGLAPERDGFSHIIARRFEQLIGLFIADSGDPGDDAPRAVGQ